MIDKNYCMSSYLAFRYIEKDDCDFAEGLHHENFKPLPDSQRKLVWTHEDMDKEIRETFGKLSGKRLGIMLSGGMDSACLASFMPGADAYTFRFLGGEYQLEELSRAERFADYYGLTLHYVDIDWNTIESNIDPILKSKSAPVHSIEPQILQAALQAKADGIELMVVGESADLVFGGMDQLLSEDWSVSSFEKRYMFTDPATVLNEPIDVHYLFERYRIDGSDRIDFLSFMDDVFAIESSGSYLNAFAVAQLPYLDPYSNLKMANRLDLRRIRNGEPKYLVQALFHSKYPELSIPKKTPMPRPVDTFFANWAGPLRPEFRNDITIESYSGNQKWQLWCLEYFLNLLDSGDLS